MAGIGPANNGCIGAILKTVTPTATATATPTEAADLRSLHINQIEDDAH